MYLRAPTSDSPKDGFASPSCSALRAGSVANLCSVRLLIYLVARKNMLLHAPVWSPEAVRVIAKEPVAPVLTGLPG